VLGGGPSFFLRIRSGLGPFVHLFLLTNYHLSPSVRVCVVSESSSQLAMHSTTTTIDQHQPRAHGDGSAAIVTLATSPWQRDVTFGQLVARQRAWRSAARQPGNK